MLLFSKGTKGYKVQYNHIRPGATGSNATTNTGPFLNKINASRLIHKSVKGALMKEIQEELFLW